MLILSSCFECHRKCLTPFSLFFSCCVFVIGKLQMRRQSQFNARKKFQYAILCVRAMVRIKRLRYTLEPLRMEDSLRDPYRVKVLRKVMSPNTSQYELFAIFSIDTEFSLYITCAFGRSSMVVPSVCTVIGWRRAKAKIGLLFSKIHRAPNCIQSIWRISADEKEETRIICKIHLQLELLFINYYCNFI